MAFADRVRTWRTSWMSQEEVRAIVLVIARCLLHPRLD